MEHGLDATMEDSSDAEEAVTVYHTADLVMTADGMRLFRIHRTVMEMLRDRGYQVSEMALGRSMAEFRAKFGAAPSRDKLGFCANKLSNPEDQVLVIFPNVATVTAGKSTVQACAEAMKVNGTRRAIMVLQKPLNPYAKKCLDQLDKQYKVEVFPETELLVNVMDSVFVPKHEVLLPEEKRAIMQKLLIPDGKEEHLPKLSRTDPVARYLGLERGQVIKVVRPGQSASDDQDRNTSYRVVI